MQMCVFAQNPIINYLRRRPSQASIHLTDIYARYRKTYSRVSFDPFPSAGFLFPRAGEEHSIRRFLAKKPPLSRGFPLGALPILGHIALLCPRRWVPFRLSAPTTAMRPAYKTRLSPSLCPAIWLSFGARSPERRTYRNSFRVHGCISLFMFCEGKCRVHRLSAEPRERVREYRYVAGAVAACATCGCSFLLFAVPLTLSSSFPPLIFVGYNGYNLNS